MRIDEFSELQWETIAASVSPSTAAAYDRALRLRILPTLGAASIATVTVADIEAAYARWSGSRSTKADALAILSRLMRRAVREGLRAHNPCRDLELQRPRTQEPMPRKLTDDQVNRLFGVVPNRWHLFIGLMVYAGLRFGEAAAVQAGDVDVEAQLLTVARQVTRQGDVTATKGGRPRVVPIRPELLSLLPAHIQDMDTQEVLCTAPEGGYIHSSNLRRSLRWPVVRDEVRPGLRFHDLRHHAATSFLIDGYPLNAVQQWLGHSNISVTSRYVTAGRQEAIAAVTRMNAARAGAVS